MRKKMFMLVVVIGMVIIGAVLWKKLWWVLDTEWAALSESSDYLANRERGFYNMRGVTISDDNPVEEWVYKSIENEKDTCTLELLQINIGEFTDRPVSEAGMNQVQRVLDSYKNRQVSLILRVLYDWDGKGMESEPEDLNIVLKHMEQFGEIISEYDEKIYIVQGVFVGSWAEMHNSRHLSEESYLTLIHKMNEVIPQSVFLAVRTPAYWRTAAGTEKALNVQEAMARKTLASRLSLFNDGILGTLLDCGTYGDIKKEESAKITDKWIRQDELEFQSVLNLYVPNGGEVVLDNRLNDLSEADEYFQVMHVSYLNSAHDTEVLEKWRNSVYRESGSVYDGMNGFEYIERHLGYRFVLRDVTAKTRGLFGNITELSLDIENVGYGNRYTECNTEIVLKNTETGKLTVLSVDTDVRLWNPGEKKGFSVSLELERGVCYEVYFRITGQKDGTSVLLANKEIIAKEEGYFLGTIRKGSSL